MAQNRITERSQFRLSTMLFVIASIGVFCASATWVVQSDDLGTLTDLPVPIVPSIPLMGVGLFIVPFACFAAVLAMFVLFITSSPRPLSAFVFFGFFVMAMFMNSGWWDNSLRLLFAMTLSSVAMLFESLIRRLPKSQIVAATISMFVSLGYYVFLVSAVASASV